MLIGFAVGASLGLLLGGLVGLSGAARAALAPTVQAIRAVPSLAWVPLLLLWLGIGETPKITLVAIGAFFPVYTTVSAGLDHVDPRLRELGRAYGRRGPALLAQVLIPAAAPAVLSGLRLGLAQGWLFLVAAELIASSMGLGFLLIDSENTGRTDILLLAIVLLALLGKASDALLGVAERQVVRRWS
ncbi:ABC transporter permease [Streptomyces himalayensis]|uniref:ABC transporter permease n=1 Tax=Streptomyces himalayensis TaxID=2820085 RepID=UPI001C6979F2|nr:ABC transporter permease subunit [Streptomyces himalayensis]